MDKRGRIDESKREREKENDINEMPVHVLALREKY